MTTLTREIKRKIGLYAAPNVMTKHLQIGIDSLRALLLSYEEDLMQIEMFNNMKHGTIPSAKDIFDEIITDLHNYERFEEESCQSLKERAERWKPVAEAYFRVCKCPNKEKDCVFMGMDLLLERIIGTLGHALLVFDAMNNNKDIVKVLLYIQSEDNKFINNIKNRL